MFKAKLIENQEYYKLRRKLLLIGIPSSIIIGIIGNFSSLSNFWLVAILPFVIAILMIQNKIQKGIFVLIKNRGIEIDNEFIKIKSKSGEIQEQIQVDSIDKIVVKDYYSIPQETLKKIFKEMTGDQLKNYIIIDIAGRTKKYEFTIDSYFMIEHIKKVINLWQSNGVNIETVT